MDDAILAQPRVPLNPAPALTCPSRSGDEPSLVPTLPPPHIAAMVKSSAAIRAQAGAETIGREDGMGEGRQEQRDKGRTGRLGRFAPLAAILAAIALFFILGLDEWISFRTLSENRDELQAFVDRNYLLAVLAFVAIYAAATALSVPGATILTVSGGFLFGSILGTVWAVIGATIGATLVFLAARTAFSDLLRRKAGGWVRRMEEGFRENAFSYLLFLRLVPVFPFFIVNLVPAFLGVRLGTYVLATFIGIIPGGFVYAQVGQGLDSIFAAGGMPDLSDVLTWDVVLAMAGLGLLALLPVAVRKLRGNRRVPGEERIKH